MNKNRIYNMKFEVELGASSAREARSKLKEWIKNSGGIDKFVSVNGRIPIDCKTKTQESQS